MSLPWILICPSSRGIGHALTHRLLAATTLPILATTRSKDISSAKDALLEGLSSPDDVAPRLSVVRCDVTDEDSISEAAQHARELFPAKSHHLRLAFAIPGVLYPEKSPKQVDAAKSLESFQINSVGPLLLMKHFGEMLPRRSTEMAGSSESDEVRMPAFSTWLSMTARVGSITDNRAGGWYSYRASKTAVSSLSKSFDNYMGAQNGDKAVAIGYHPGTVKTDLSRGFWSSVEEGKLFSPEYAAERMVSVATGLDLSQRGKCWDWKNEEVPP